MERLDILLNDAAEYDKIIRNSLPEGGDLRIITKDGAMVSGAAGAMITFTVEVDGKPRRAQAVTSVKLLRALLGALVGRYDDDGMKRPEVPT